MNRKNIVSLILLDLIVMLLSLGLLIYRYQSLTGLLHGEQMSTDEKTGRTIAPASVPDIRYDASEPNVPAPQAIEKISDTKTKRHIRFTFRHSRAKKVELIGDFNNWIPRAMAKGEKHTWGINLEIAEGEYAYNFVIDGKPIRDPNNPKVCNAGRGFPNSLLVVKEMNKEKKKVD